MTNMYILITLHQSTGIFDNYMYTNYTVLQELTMHSTHFIYGYMALDIW